jgi:hypothetical protein
MKRGAKELVFCIEGVWDVGDGMVSMEAHISRFRGHDCLLKVVWEIMCIHVLWTTNYNEEEIWFHKVRI